jgi:hypothetical protein
LRDFGHLAAGWYQAQGIARGIHHGMDRGAQRPPRKRPCACAPAFLGRRWHAGGGY